MSWNYLVCSGRTAGQSYAFGVTRYSPAAGAISAYSVGTSAQIIVRDIYRIGRYYVRVLSNTCDGAMTVTLERNAVGTNQTVSIPAGATGVFQYTSGTVVTASGDYLRNTMVVAGTVGLVYITMISFLAVGPRSTTISNTDGMLKTSGVTSYIPIAGCTLAESAVETDAYYTFRDAGTLRNLFTRCLANTLGNASTVRTRINGINGNQVLSIPAGATGYYEDAVNTDAIVAGQNVNLSLVVGAGGGNFQVGQFTQRLQAPWRPILSLSMQLTGYAVGAARYRALSDFATLRTATETDVLTLCHTNFRARYLFINVSVNTSTTAMVYTMRKNAGASATNLTVTVGAGLTGIFEDLNNIDYYAPTDTIDFCEAGTVGAGLVTITGQGVVTYPPVDQSWPHPAVESLALAGIHNN